ncbi:MAG: pyridoxal-dependent decarboxylase [Gemmatimonadaceae bacterium]
MDHARPPLVRLSAPVAEPASGAAAVAAELPAETSLDPADWAAMRALGHRMVDDMMGYLQTVRDRPAWTPIPKDVKASFRAPVPREPEGAERAYEAFRTAVLPYPTGNIHPRFWGWVMGTGTPLGVLAEMLAAAMNPNVWGGEQSATYVEAQVLDWCKTMLGVPASASGLLVSGGSAANLVCLAVARDAMAGDDVARRGIAALPGRPVVYCSTETHNSVEKAVALLGLGTGALRKLPATAAYTLDVAALAAAISADRARGDVPLCVVANAGTVNTGAVDDLERVADVAAEHGVWMHVDGAFGALAALSPALRPLLRGLERADSVAFDLHKWLYMPYEVGCALIRRADAHRRAFAPPAGYLAHDTRGAASGEHWFGELGIELSRGFRALKVWMSLKEHGADRYARQIEQNVAQARYLAALVEASPELELAAPVSLNVVCFRARAPHATGSEAQDALNREILLRIHERGVAVPSATTLAGRYTIRVAITNHRSRREDFDTLVAAARDLARELTRATGGT